MVLNIERLHTLAPFTGGKWMRGVDLRQPRLSLMAQSRERRGRRKRSTTSPTRLARFA